MTLPVISEKNATDTGHSDIVNPVEIRLAPTHVTGDFPNRRRYVSTVLVIDDDVLICNMLEKFLKKQGFQVIIATTGEEGLRLAKEQRPDLITLDVLMPGVDGWTVLRELKTDVDLASIPVVMLTMSDDKNMSYALGATHFLSKPLDRHLLVNVIRECVRHLN